MTRFRTLLDVCLTGPRRFAGAVLSAAAVVVLLASVAGPASAASRIKDIADFEGVRDNLLIGYGLVVGLQGTGDDIDSMAFTKESLMGMLERLGVNTRGGQLKAKNVAAVMVTAQLPPFGRQGARMDISVSALGDADSLLGGTLMVTPLVGADGEVYAVAQGQVQVGGFFAQGQAASVQKGVPTSGRIPSGAIIEREIAFEMNGMSELSISLRNPDFTTAQRISQAINAFLGTAASNTRDAGTVTLRVPEQYRANMVGLLTDIEQLRVEPDQQARVVIDEQTGIIVIGENVRVSRVAIAQGNLTIRVTETPQVSQPGPFAEAGETVVVPRTEIEIDEDAEKRLTVVDGGVNLQELVNGLNALGIGPRDMISILQAIKAAGALQAEIEVM
ncbi:MAG: flagellar basal body P-ring protein FlgI [Rhodospirillaceae bacterium]